LSYTTSPSEIRGNAGRFRPRNPEKTRRITRAYSSFLFRCYSWAIPASRRATNRRSRSASAGLVGSNRTVLNDGQVAGILPAGLVQRGATSARRSGEKKWSVIASDRPGGAVPAPISAVTSSPAAGTRPAERRHDAPSVRRAAPGVGGGAGSDPLRRDGRGDPRGPARHRPARSGRVSVGRGQEARRTGQGRPEARSTRRSSAAWPLPSWSRSRCAPPAASGRSRPVGPAASPARSWAMEAMAVPAQISSSAAVAEWSPATSAEALVGPRAGCGLPVADGQKTTLRPVCPETWWLGHGLGR
jgi:hypothetical protein